MHKVQLDNFKAQFVRFETVVADCKSVTELQQALQTIPNSHQVYKTFEERLNDVSLGTQFSIKLLENSLSEAVLTQQVFEAWMAFFTRSDISTEECELQADLLFLMEHNVDVFLNSVRLQKVVTLKRSSSKYDETFHEPFHQDTQSEQQKYSVYRRLKLHVARGDTMEALHFISKITRCGYVDTVIPQDPLHNQVRITYTDIWNKLITLVTEEMEAACHAECP